MTGIPLRPNRARVSQAEKGLQGLRDARYARHPPGLARIILVRQNDRFFELRVPHDFAPETGVLAVRDTGFANQSSIYGAEMGILDCSSTGLRSRQ